MADKSNVVKFKGILTSYEYAAAPQDKGGKKKHRIGVKVTPEVLTDFKKAIDAAGVYKNSSDAFKPKWYKDADAEYINLSSSFDIRALYWDADGLPIDTTVADLTADRGILNGSNVVVACNLKDGAVYPACVGFTQIKVLSMADLFDSDDMDLPFN